MLNYIDTTIFKGRLTINRIDYYLVEDYSDNKHTEHLIDSFAYKNKHVNINDYGLYKMFFYKKSAKTNPKNLSENPRDLYRYSQDHDLIFMYNWINGKFAGRYKLKNGEIIEPKHNIELEDIPDQ
jgi:hypothetical protein